MINIDKQKLREQMKNNPDKFLEDYINSIYISESLKVDNALLKDRVDMLETRLYGKKTETKIDPNKKYPTLFNIDEFYDNQDHFNEAEANQNENEADVLDDNGEPVIKTTDKKKRKNLVNRYDKLETEVVVHDLADEEKNCDKCGSKLKLLSTTYSYKLKYIPAKLIRVKHITSTYYCPKCNNNANEPNNVIQTKIPTCFPKCMVEPSVIANIISDKFIKCLPLYRQEKLYNNYGLDVTRSNLSNWFIKGAEVLEPLYELMKKDILTEDIIHMDETTLTVIESKKKAYMWGMCSSKWSNNNIKIYIYKPDRKYSNANEILEGYTGYVQSDGYEAYQRVTNVTNVGCFAHARRKYAEIIKALKNTGSSVTLADKGINYINKLYSIEHKIAKLSDKTVDNIYSIRQKEAKPILEDYYNWCKETYAVLPKQTAIAKAIAYSLNNYEYLSNYLLDGRLSMDNNICEQLMKSFVLSRKNFLFCFSENGADKSSIAYSVLETARANQLKPEDYLNYVFEQLGKLDNPTEDDYKNLLPYSKILPSYLKKHSE